MLRRSSAAVLEVLLVSAHTNPEQLVLPKGHIEPGETEAETAVREVLEESGVWATVIGTAQTVQFTTGGTDYGVAFFPMMHIATDRVSTEHRSVEWVAVEGIAKRGVLPESADLVATFQGDARVIRQLNGA